MSQRALVCDYDLRIRRSLELLPGAEGYEVTAAASAEEALELFTAPRPNIAVVDLSLPGEDGIWLCERLRERSELPVLVLSVVDEEGEKVRALEAGADDYVTKPFGREYLLARLSALLRRSGEPEEDRIETPDGLEIDLAGTTVRRGGELIRLTPTELRLLTALVHSRGRLLTHRKPLAEVWGSSRSTTSICCVCR